MTSYTISTTLHLTSMKCCNVDRVKVSMTKWGILLDQSELVRHVELQLLDQRVQENHIKSPQSYIKHGFAVF